MKYKEDYMIEKLYFHRGKDENWDIIDKAEELEYECANNLSYLGYEIGMKVEISPNGKVKILQLEGVDISDKEIYMNV
jgi:hypothetical protein